MEKSVVIVTGGAGYIGSHIVHLLVQKGYQVIVIDHAEKQEHLLLLPSQDNLTLFKADFADELVLDHIFTNFTVDAVIHCAAFIEVGESVKDPQRFYENNVVKTHKLLKKMLEYNVKRFIFSSSCAVYGVPQEPVLTEAHSRNPVSPYGTTKYITEKCSKIMRKHMDCHIVLCAILMPPAQRQHIAWASGIPPKPILFPFY